MKLIGWLLGNTPASGTSAKTTDAPRIAEPTIGCDAASTPASQAARQALSTPAAKRTMGKGGSKAARQVPATTSLAAQKVSASSREAKPSLPPQLTPRQSSNRDLSTASVPKAPVPKVPVPKAPVPKAPITKRRQVVVPAKVKAAKAIAALTAAAPAPPVPPASPCFNPPALPTPRKSVKVAKGSTLSSLQLGHHLKQRTFDCLFFAGSRPSGPGRSCKSSIPPSPKSSTKPRPIRVKMGITERQLIKHCPRLLLQLLQLEGFAGKFMAFARQAKKPRADIMHASSLVNLRKAIMKYLGWRARHKALQVRATKKGVQAVSLVGMEMLLSVAHFEAYLEALEERELGFESVLKEVNLLQVCLEFISVNILTKSQAEELMNGPMELFAAAKAFYSAGVDKWYQKKVKAVQAPEICRDGSLTAPCTALSSDFMPEPEDFLDQVKILFDQAEKALRSDPGSYKTARLVMRAVMIGLQCGFYIPPLRPSMVVSLQMPPKTAAASKKQQLAQESCSDPDCRTRGCRGNRITRMTGPDGKDALDLHFPHHKTQLSRSTQQEEIETSVANTSQLYNCLIHLLDWAWQKIKDKKGGKKRSLTAKGPDTLALWPTGRSVVDREYAGWWRTVGTVGMKAGCVPSVPRECRHLFVTAVRDNEVARPEEEGIIATIMGNSPHAWDLRYDKHRASRVAQGSGKLVSQLYSVLMAKLAKRNT